MADFPTPSTFVNAWDCSSAKDYGTFAVSGALALTSLRTGDNYGGSAVATLIADGTHIPTFDGVASPHYNNVAGAQNLVSLVDIGSELYWSVAVTLPGASLVPLWAAAPTLSPSYVGATVSITGTATGATSYSYQWLDNGTNISGATASTYTITSGQLGHTITCLVTAVNANGSVPILSGSTVPTGADYLAFGGLSFTMVAAAGASGYAGYAPTSATANFNALGYSPSRKLQASPSADVYFTFLNDQHGSAFEMGLHTDKSTASGIFQTPDSLFEFYDNGTVYSNYHGGLTNVASVAAASGDICRFRRTSANVLYFEVSKDGGSTYTVGASGDVSGYGDLYPRIGFSGYVAGINGIVKCTGAGA